MRQPHANYADTDSPGSRPKPKQMRPAAPYQHRYRAMIAENASITGEEPPPPPEKFPEATRRREFCCNQLSQEGEIASDADELVLELPLEAHECGGCQAKNQQLRNIVRIRFRDRSHTKDFDAGDGHIAHGEKVVIETEQGLVVGEAARGSLRTLSGEALPRVVRRLDYNDVRQQARNAFREREAFDFCRERIQQRNLPMKLIRVEYLHGGSKAIFFFSAEHRVDFRELVKDLAQRFHIRIVMRQVGVRDEAKMTGGIGSCGQNLCCAMWLSKFEPVSIRMAKDQNLVLNPQKVSGQCGRLKCCLMYEQEQYQEERKKLPKLGRLVMTPDGEGRVRDLDVLRRRVGVIFEDGTTQTYWAEQLKPVDQAAARNQTSSEVTEEEHDLERDEFPS
jgi:cell fate regulator YaaT (PSP1 superfamily)